MLSSSRGGQSNGNRAPEEIFSVKSVISKRTSVDQNIDLKERYKQALKDKLSDNASQHQRSSRSRSVLNRSQNCEIPADRESFSAFSNRISTRAGEINQQKSSPLRVKKVEPPSEDESIPLAMGLDNNSIERIRARRDASDIRAKSGSKKKTSPLRSAGKKSQSPPVLRSIPERRPMEVQNNIYTFENNNSSQVIHHSSHPLLGQLEQAYQPVTSTLKQSQN